MKETDWGIFGKGLDGYIQYTQFLKEGFPHKAPQSDLISGEDADGEDAEDEEAEDEEDGEEDL